MTGDVKAQLILSAADLIINKGFPALVSFVNTLNNKDSEDPITVEDIEAVKGDLDSDSYFK